STVRTGEADKAGHQDGENQTRHVILRDGRAARRCGPTPSFKLTLSPAATKRAAPRFQRCADESITDWRHCTFTLWPWFGGFLTRRTPITMVRAAFKDGGNHLDSLATLHVTRQGRYAWPQTRAVGAETRTSQTRK